MPAVTYQLSVMRAKKVYNFPIFYFPKLSHPDPTVDRRSGFLTPTLYDTKNLGSGISIPYFFDLGLLDFY